MGGGRLAVKQKAVEEISRRPTGSGTRGGRRINGHALRRGSVRRELRKVTLLREPDT